VQKSRRCYPCIEEAGEKIGVVSKTAPHAVFVTDSYRSKRLARCRARISLGE
jgi:hypothetical protein